MYICAEIGEVKRAPRTARPHRRKPTAVRARAMATPLRADSHGPVSAATPTSRLHRPEPNAAIPPPRRSPGARAVPRPSPWPVILSEGADHHPPCHPERASRPPPPCHPERGSISDRVEGSPPATRRLASHLLRLAAGEAGRLLTRAVGPCVSPLTSPVLPAMTAHRPGGPCRQDPRNRLTRHR